MDELFMDCLDALREAVGFPLHVNSGYRCPEHNTKVSSTGLDGPHTTGQAADIGIDRGRAYELVVRLKEFEFTGVGLNQKGSSRYIHLDTLGRTNHRLRPTIWTY